MVEVLEHCRVAPPPGTVAERSLQLTFFDLLFFNSPPIQDLLFYEFSRSNTTYFKENIIPNLKHSLSLCLQHFFPLAGNLVIPSNNSNKPEIRYLDGDSVSLTLAQSSSYDDFNNLTGNHPRNASEFYAFLPKLPQIPKLFKEDTSIESLIPVLAIQVTLFPNVGICLGFTYHHLIGDASTCVRFMRSWASISKLGSDINCALPFYDRSVVSDPNGLRNIMLSQLEYSTTSTAHEDEYQTHQYQVLQLPINKVRATFLMHRSNVQRLKELVLTRLGRPTKELCHVSTFTVTCAFLWVCWVKSGAAIEEDDSLGDENELETFVCSADCRNGRTNPPIPETYFGNCQVPCTATAKRGLLMGEEGSLIAAELIGEAIAKRLHSNNGEGLLEGADMWVLQWSELNWERILTVAGSPMFRVYDMDFGWGNPKKREIISIDGSGAISVSESKDSEAGLEIGLSLPKNRMNAFSSIFAHGLETICKVSKGG